MMPSLLKVEQTDQGQKISDVQRAGRWVKPHVYTCRSCIQLFGEPWTTVHPFSVYNLETGDPSCFNLPCGRCDEASRFELVQ